MPPVKIEKHKGGRPNWYTSEHLEQIRIWVEEGLSRSEIGRRFDKQAASITRIIQEYGWEVKADQIAEEKRTADHKICNQCKEDKPLTEFQIRYDRKNREGLAKYFGKCIECRATYDFPKIQEYNKNYHQNNADSIRENKRDYRKRFPEKQREYSHQRRSHKSQTRFEPFDEKTVWEYCNGLCYVCGKPVDFNKRGQKPDSFSIEHIIPVIKKGPTSYNNLAVSHFGCNSSKKHLIVPDVFKDYSFKEIVDKQEIYKISIEKHYLHRKRGFSFAYGLYDKNNNLKGFVGFSSPTSHRTAKSVCPTDPKLVIELSRLWIDPMAPVNAGSWLISRALKMLPPRIVISYSDTSIKDERTGRYHTGLIYQSLNFYYAGISAITYEYVAGNTRHVTKDTPGSVKVTVPARHRYWTLSGNKRDKRNLFKLCEWDILDPPIEKAR